MPNQCSLKLRLHALAEMLQDIAAADKARAQLAADLPYASGIYMGSSNACALAASWIREEIFCTNSEVADDE